MQFEKEKDSKGWHHRHVKCVMEGGHIKKCEKGSREFFLVHVRSLTLGTSCLISPREDI
jgi:hypothetical protein